jgi:hypothetical protein
MDGSEISSAVLLSIAVGFLTYATSFFNAGNVPAGLICAIVGVALVFATILLVEKGIIQRMKIKGGGCE